MKLNCFKLLTDEENSIVCCSMLAFAGCKEVDPIEPPVPQEPDEISVIEVTSDNPVELGNEGGVFDVTLATDTEGAELVAADFEAETSADWLTFNAPATGDATSATRRSGTFSRYHHLLPGC